MPAQVGDLIDRQIPPKPMNTLLITCLMAWAIAQAGKVLVILLRDGRLDARFFFRSGGMPSSHSATVTALATSVGMIEGIDSTAFAVSGILALVVMYDAAGVRRAVGRQSIILNRIVNELRLKGPRDVVERDIRQLVGHTPFQVFTGAALGFIVAWLWITL